MVSSPNMYLHQGMWQQVGPSDRLQDSDRKRRRLHFRYENEIDNGKPESKVSSPGVQSSRWRDILRSKERETNPSLNIKGQEYSLAPSPKGLKRGRIPLPCSQLEWSKKDHLRRNLRNAGGKKQCSRRALRKVREKGLQKLLHFS